MSSRHTPEQRRSYAERAYGLGRGGDRVVAAEAGVKPATVARWRRRLCGLRHEPSTAAHTASAAVAAATLRPAAAAGDRTRPEFLSPTAASMFRQCPRRWKMRYIDKLPDPPSVSGVVGTFAHLVLQRLLCLDPDRRSIEQARSIARSEWDAFADGDAYKGLDLSVGEGRDFRWRAWRAVEGLFELEDPAAVDVVSTEREVSAVIGGVPFKGIVDRVERDDGELVVTDYKSGRAPPAGFGGKDVDQVLLYAAALEAVGEPAARVAVVYLGQRRVGTAASKHAVAAAVDRLAETWADINDAEAADSFEPRPSPLCGWCPYLSLCPEGAARTESYEQAA